MDNCRDAGGGVRSVWGYRGLAETRLHAHLSRQHLSGQTVDTLAEDPAPEMLGVKSVSPAEALQALKQERKAKRKDSKQRKKVTHPITLSTYFIHTTELMLQHPCRSASTWTSMPKLQMAAHRSLLAQVHASVSAYVHTMQTF